MASHNRLQFRLADPFDAEAVAALHVASWRRHYRGAYADAYLDGDVTSDRLAVWRGRLEDRRGKCCTIVARDADALVGFAHVAFDDDPIWGALLDNLHVTHECKRRGIGSQLLTRAARAITERESSSGLYLWVLEQNVEAQAFYAARGGTFAERSYADPPGGISSRLNGRPVKLRYAWPDPNVLLTFSS